MTEANKIVIPQFGGGKRDVSIDILKGIGIILVLVAHSLGEYVHTFAYSFHMPLFFIVAGYFCKAKPIASTMQSDFKRLFIPFFFTTSVMFITSLYYLNSAVQKLAENPSA